MKKELSVLLKCAAVCIAGAAVISAAVALLLRTPFLASQKAFLYRLLMITALCCAVLLIVIFIYFRGKEMLWGLSFSTCVLCIGLSSLFMALFFSLGPMTIERSYTIYSLADMTDHAERVYSAEDIKIQFIEGYIEGADASQKRIDEQVAIGNLEEMDGGYRITPKGKRLVGLFRLVEVFFPVPDESSIYPNGH